MADPLTKGLLGRVAALSSRQLARNVGANALAVGWNGLLIVLVTPWYVSILGMEGYGLVGFWVLLQVVLAFCDLGLGATLVREFASAQGMPDETNQRGDLLRTLEWVYWPLAAALAVLLFVAAGWVARDWLKLQSLPASQVARSVEWMALALGLQLPGALYSSGLIGLQRQGSLALLQTGGNTLRHGGGLAILLWGADPASYFMVQALASGVQTCATRATLSRGLGGVDNSRPVFRATLLRHVWRFSAGMATTTMAAVLLGNVDRLFLSTLLPAAELGKYSVAWAATGLLQLGIQPFYRAYFPRFAELRAAGDAATLRKEYYDGCRIVAQVIIPAALIGGMFAPELFSAWLGYADQTSVAAFRLLLLGVGCAGLMWLPAAFQQAHGWTRLRAMMIAGGLAIGAGTVWWTIRLWGTVGATSVWVVHGVSDLTLGLWLMHRRLLPGELGHWWRVVLAPPLLCCVPIVAVSRLIVPASLGRWSLALWLGATGLAAITSLLLLWKGDQS